MKITLAVVVAQLIPEYPGSNLVISKLLLSIFTVRHVCKRRK